MRSMLVIGLGRFGSPLARKLAELGNEVLAIDRNAEAVDDIADDVTRAQIGDCMDEAILKSLGVDNFDACFVCISDDFQSSLEITSLLKDLGARKVVCKVDRDIHAKFLLKIGADEVVYPERDMAQRTALRFSTNGAFDYISLTPEYAITEVALPEAWVGRSLADLNVRTKYDVNVIAVKSGDKITPVTRADLVLRADEHLLIAGGKEDIARMMDRV